MKHVQTTMYRCAVLWAVTLMVVVTGCNAASQTRDEESMIQQMVVARQNGTQTSCVTGTYGPLSLQRAYRIQQKLARELAPALGPVVGYKVAYASKAAQEQFGVNEPARGPFYLAQRVPSGSVLPVSMFNEIMLETEVAFSIGKRIDKPIPDVASLKGYVKYVFPAFDASDFPYLPGEVKPTPSDMVAIGTGAHVYVLGPAMDPARVNVDVLNLALIRNGQTIREKPSIEVLGSPWNSLLWCVNHVVQYGDTVEPGMVTSTGTAAPAYRVRGNEIKGTYVGDCGALGKVTLTIE